MARKCPHCGEAIESGRNPVPTVDIVIHAPTRGIVLVKRRNEPHGWALPGGFVDSGETVQEAARREAREETGLDVALTGILGVYSDPNRDPRMHTLSIVFTACPADVGALIAGDDAGDARFFKPGEWPSSVVFDHPTILEDYMKKWQWLNPGQD